MATVQPSGSRTLQVYCRKLRACYKTSGRAYLKDQPFVQLLLPGSSLYALANAVFPGTRIMLREHFRCVEPIIRFSFQFYPEPIIPLGIPKPSERLDPPLIDLYLPHGRKDRRKITKSKRSSTSPDWQVAPLASFRWSEDSRRISFSSYCSNGSVRRPFTVTRSLVVTLQRFRARSATSCSSVWCQVQATVH